MTTTTQPAQTLFGVADALVAMYGREPLLRLLHPRGDPSFVGRYARPNGDEMNALSLRKHLYWAGKGFRLVAIVTLNAQGAQVVASRSSVVAAAGPGASGRTCVQPDAPDFIAAQTLLEQ